MYKKINILGMAVIGTLCLGGCGGGIILERDAVNGAQILSEEIVQVNPGIGNTAEETDSSVSEGTESNGAETEAEDLKELTVHVCGAVKMPGVYVLTEDARLYEAIALAGGFGEEAAEEYLNLALPLEDGMQIAVPTKEEAEQLSESEGTSYPAGIRQGNGVVSPQETKKDDRVNINTADKAELMTLPGIGESRAQAIISYREQNGNFQTKEELMNVSGIKEASYRKLEEYIAVSG